MAPELFPDNITHPADQLQRMFEVGQSIRVSESSLDAYYGKYAAEHKRWQQNDFAEAVRDCLSDLRTVQRYAQEQTEEEAEDQAITLEQAEALWAELKTVRRNYDKVNARNLLSHHDEMQVGRLLRGEMLPEHLEHEENAKGILAVYEAKQAYEAVAGQLTRYKRQIRAKRMKQADEYALDAIGGTRDPWLVATGKAQGLSNQEKAVLWQLQNKSWKPYSNPYDRKIGQEIYDILWEDDGGE